MSSSFLERVAQLGQLWTGKLREMSGNLVVEMACLGRQALGALQESLRLAKGLFVLLELFQRTQEGTRIVEESAAAVAARREPAGIEGLDLGAGELLPRDLLGQPLAGFQIEASQRNQGFHRRLGGDLTLTDRLLNRQREIAHQAQASRHPADTSEEPPRQLFLAPAKTTPQLGEQPTLLKRRGAWSMGHLPLQHQRIARLHLPNQGLDRVVTQVAQGLDALVAVDDHIVILRLRLRHHHDRLLLAVLFQAEPQTALASAAVSAQRGIGHLQLVEFQLHDGLLLETHVSLLGQGPTLKRLGEPSSMAAQRSHSHAPRPAKATSQGLALAQGVAEVVFGVFPKSVHKPISVWIPRCVIFL